jgi:hypothetical protein
MTNHQDKPGIFTNTKTTRPSSTSHLIADGPNGHRVKNSPQDREFGSASAHTHVPDNGMLPNKPAPCVDLSSDHTRSHQIGCSAELGRSG